MWQSYFNVPKYEEVEAVKAVLWISRARVKEGKPDEAKKILAEAIVPKIGNSGNEQVEGLIQQLCSLVAPKRRRVSAPTPPPADASAPKPADGAAPSTPATTAPVQLSGPTFDET